jgi:peptidoglycan/LPS O-acetylase OafA/YrhL
MIKHPLVSAFREGALGYRADIDGLRAVSITLVVLFHFGLAGLPGGFVGVDVFFVISGYLITGILLREIEAGSFSLLTFYERRVRRILPALIAVILVTLFAGALVLLPGDYKETARSAIYSAFSLANVYFLRNTGYFDNAADTMPLLHIWSLAVEEQFYIIWPVLLALLAFVFRNRRGPIVTVCIAFALASFAWSVYLVSVNPKSAFYLPQTRAWELALGAIVAMVPLGRWPRMPALAQLAGVTGLGLILFGAFMLTRESPFPGANALFPVVGAALLVAPWQEAHLVRRALSVAPVVFLGKISYSLYLWHWPVLVLWKHYTGAEELTAIEATALGLLSLILAAASWRWIEQPFRRARGFRGLIVVSSGVAAAAVCSLIALPIVHTDGLPGRLPPELQALGSKDLMWNYPCAGKVADGPAKGLCFVGVNWSTASTRAIVWGESHAEHLLALLDVAGRKAGVSVALVKGCPPIIKQGGVQRRGDTPQYSANCARHNASTVNLLNKSPDINLVLLSWTQRYGGYYYPGREVESHEAGLALLRDALDDFLPDITAAGRLVVIVGDVPKMPIDPIPCVLSEYLPLRRACDDTFRALPRNTFDKAQGDVIETVRAAASRHPNTVAHMLSDYMCDGARCMTYLNREFLYRDAGHLRRNLSSETTEEFAELLKLDALLASAVAKRQQAVQSGTNGSMR